MIKMVVYNEGQECHNSSGDNKELSHGANDHKFVTFINALLGQDQNYLRSKRERKLDDSITIQSYLATLIYLTEGMIDFRNRDKCEKSPNDK
ncbi:hypothetical protein C0J52_11337 [Blattella germanica]|nr:hypothetical protein C0J52_11337 [Blattella germanica]